MSQKIRIKLRSYDHNLVDKSAEKIVKTVKSTGAVVSGPIPLPTHKRIFTVLRSPHVNKKAREQFQLCSYKRLMDIYSSSSKTIDALMKLARSLDSLGKASETQRPILYVRQQDWRYSDVIPHQIYDPDARLWP